MRNRLGAAAFVAVILGIAGLIVPSALAAHDTVALRYFSDESVAGGASRLERNGNLGMLSASVHGSNLTPGAAYTHWYVIFNNPEACSDGVCGEDDIFIDPETPNAAQINAVRIAVLGGHGQIANGGGHASFRGRLFEDSALGNDVVLGPGGLIEFPYLLEDAMKAEVHIVVRNHGPAQSGADLAEQLLTFWGNCTGLPVDDDASFECVDEQFAVHLP